MSVSSIKTNSSNHCLRSGLKTEDSKEDLVNHLGPPGNHALTNNHSSDPSEPAFSDDEGEEKHKHGDDEDDDDIPLGEMRTFTQSFLDLSRFVSVFYKGYKNT